MKKIIIISLIIAITASFGIAAFQVSISSVNTTPCYTLFCPQVNWNASIPSTAAPDTVAFLIVPIDPPQPLVNWNS
jgi:hypothetical protein